MSVNKAIIIGNLERDPEVRALPSGPERSESVGSNQGAIHRSYRRASGAHLMHCQPSGSSRTIASACFPRDSKSTSRVGSEPASTKRGTGVAPAIALKS